ncbi:hypothetical protein [Rhodocaloribacter sp.]
MTKRIWSALGWTLASAALLALSGCGFVDDPDVPEEKPLQTRILAVRVEPDPVAAGDTARFTCIIEDSLDTRFRFRWILSGPGGGARVTEVNYLDWVAPEVPDTTTFTHGVEVDNGSPDSASVIKSFKVTVVARE